MTAQQPTLTGFPPLARADARVLILGSMPGQASLSAMQYYAHPRNAFWPIMAQLCELPTHADYETRVQAVLARGIAIWDVLATCQRRGSLDADIETGSIVANDFAGFLQQHAQITHVFFNGGTAERLFKRHALPYLPTVCRPACARLPSTSPAHASMGFEAKLARWQAALRELLR